MVDPVVVKEGDALDVTYIGWYADTHEIFDTSVKEYAKKAEVYKPKRKYGPKKVVVGEHKVIPGFEEALVGMAIGEEKEVYIPAEKGYGRSGSHPMAGKDLIFKLTVEDINGSQSLRLRLGWWLKNLLS
ncbi:MAG: FKBP-type peptidyl-prolyl cis-trans isomerase [Candidatus Undinarchaeales archaeon]|jgi:FKBP-type peptidyl-prolyl cis-trans isomerase 2|nr:FKBP-type peptidyl-prolyl cis-trans isomerase [Candidatus Undinarchaeales archaeon]MDP7491737.1 FKBP-type peptidyl-prolyl cis-trans isomerase [Candidatus Undinarchaeales archaeon]